MEKRKNKTNQFSFRLAPSKISGVGVFAAHGIKKGTTLNFFNRKMKPVFIPNSPKIPLLKKKFFRWFCVETPKGFFCPRDFSQMEIGYYLNHSDQPNAFCVKDDAYRASHDIKINEEITINYKNLDQKAKQGLVRRF